MTDRLLWAALLLQVLSWLTSIASLPTVVSLVLFFTWVALVPLIGYLIGKAGGAMKHAARVAGLLALAWFVLGALVLLFDKSTSPDLALVGFGGFAIACFLGTLVLVAMALLFARLGRLRPLQPNSTPHTDARDAPPAASAVGARAGGRER